jgi:hypothetical protein
MLVGVCFTLIQAVSAVGQESSKAIGDSVHCAECRIELEHVVSVRERIGSRTHLSQEATFTVGANGLLYATNGSIKSRLCIFDMSGRHRADVDLQKLGGRRVLPPQNVSSNTMLVVDVAASAFFRIEGSQGSVLAKGIPVIDPAVPASFVMAGDGVIILAANIRDPELIGFPLHVVSPTGKILRSFGAEANPQYRADRASSNVRRVGRATHQEHIWVAPINDYRLQLIDLTGVVIQDLRRTTTWFPQWTRASRTGEERTPPHILNIWQDSSKSLWVMMDVADKNWKPMSATAMTRGISADEADRLFDTRLEVIDVARGLLIASATLPERMSYGGDGIVAAYRRKGAEHTFEVSRVRLVRPLP